MTHSKGISWIDDCRIPYVNETPNLGGRAKHTRGDGYGYKALNEELEANTQGRFPANILVSDDMLNDGIITKVQENLKEQNKQYKGGNFGGGSVKNNFYFGDSGSSSRYYDIDKWFNNLIDV